MSKTKEDSEANDTVFADTAEAVVAAMLGSFGIEAEASISARNKAEVEEESAEKMKKIIFWKDETTGESGHGEPVEAALADTWVKWGNEKCPNIKHIAVDVDELAREASEE